METCYITLLCLCFGILQMSEEYLLCSGDMNKHTLRACVSLTSLQHINFNKNATMFLEIFV